MAANPYLDFDNFDDLLAHVAPKAATLDRKPDAYPQDAGERLALLSRIEADVKRLQGVLLDTLTAISDETSNIDKTLRANSAKFADVNIAPVTDLKDVDYLRFCTADELRLLFGAMCRVWKQYKDSREFHAEFPASWRKFHKDVRKPSVVQQLPKTIRPWARQIAGFSDERQEAHITLSTVFLLRVRNRTELRILLGILRDVFRAMDGVRQRLEALIATPIGPPGADTPAKPSKRFEIAFQAFNLAEQGSGESLNDLDAYEWLKENGPEDYQLPDFATWVRYVRGGRAFYSQQKNQPRAGRTGRSIVRPDDLDRPD